MRLKDFLGIVLLASLWGPTFLATKIIVQEIPPMTLSFLRCFLASLSLLVICKLQKQNLRPLLKNWKNFAIGGILGNALPFIFCSWGEIYVASSTAGIIEGIIPILTLIFAFLLNPKQKLSKEQLAGVFLGFIGLLVIFFPGILSKDPLINGPYNNEETIGKTLLILMSCCFALNFVFTKQKFSSYPAISSVTMQMLYATIFLIPLTLYMESPLQLPIPSIKTILNMFALGSLGTAISWWLYNYLIKSISATQLSLATYLCPIFAIVLGIFFLEENPTWNLYLGITIIIMALALSCGAIKFHKKILNEPDSSFHP